MVVDGEEGKPYDKIGTVPVISPDSRRVAYSAEKNDKWFVVVDGKEGRSYDDIATFENAGIIFDASDRLHYLAIQNDDLGIIGDDSLYLVEEKIEGL